MPHQLDRWMYCGGRPNRLARFLNGIWTRTAAAGLPPQRMHTLEVRGRRSGRLRSFPVVVADYEGERYLELAPGARPHIPVDPNAFPAAFERIVSQCPVFRVLAAGADASADDR